MRLRSSLAFVLGAVLAGCAAHTIERSTLDRDSLSKISAEKLDKLKAASPYLKAHMRNGNLYLFSKWEFDRPDSTISGQAILFDPNRDTLGEGARVVGLDSVALVETNVIKRSGSATAMTIMMGITAAVTVYCITNPKACFGSCPTFYTSDGRDLHLQAEGFSSSISPSLEATDVDALYHGAAKDGHVTLVMKNEALETHVVRQTDLLAVPHPNGCRVFASSDLHFWESPEQLPPVTAKSSEGDCLPLLLTADGIERFSLADENYLGSKESIDLVFHVAPDQKYGLVIGCRQTLLPTYLLYQTLAYMGGEAGDLLAKLERKSIARPDGMAELIGGIEVNVLTREGPSVQAGLVIEHGPLAMDMHLILLPAVSDSTLHLQLRMTKGTWRIDYVGLAQLSRQVQAVRIQPGIVMKDGVEDVDARSRLIDSSKVLVTFPGDEYRLKYSLPSSHTEYELFVETRGYYLEWMRKEWIEEENPLLLSQLMVDPEGALKRLAPEFKRVEPQMEECFWRSRYAKP
jgi:hypothetical protein